jgi:hypothetical protein
MGYAPAHFYRGMFGWGFDFGIYSAAEMDCYGRFVARGDKMKKALHADIAYNA